MNAIGYWVTHPGVFLSSIVTVLFYPILALELAAFAFAVFEFGRFTIEVFPWAGQRRDLAGIETAAREARAKIIAGRYAEAARALSEASARPLFTRYFAHLVEKPDLSRVHLLKSLSDLESHAARRLERTRLLIRLGPTIGLMTTLIPISPALVALANGDTQTLSANLLIAFSTTVIGLLIGGLGYTMSLVRDRRYAQDISDVEYALDLMQGAGSGQGQA